MAITSIAIKAADGAQMTSVTGGTGTLTLTSIANKPTFQQKYPTGTHTIPYIAEVISGASLGMFEIADGTFDASAGTLARPGTVLSWIPGTGYGTTPVTLPTSGVVIGSGISVGMFNKIIADLIDLQAQVTAISNAYKPGGTDVAVADGGTGASTVGTAQANLSLVPGTHVQAYSANLSEYASVNPTPQGLALMDDVDQAAQRATIGLVEDDGKIWITLSISAVDVDVTLGDIKNYVAIPSSFDGFELVDVMYDVATAGTGGANQVQLVRDRAGTTVNMLSTKVSIDAGEKSSLTATTAFVIDSANKGLQTGDRIYADADAVSSTAAKGGQVSFAIKKAAA